MSSETTQASDSTEVDGTFHLWQENAIAQNVDATAVTNKMATMMDKTPVLMWTCQSSIQGSSL